MKRKILIIISLTLMLFSCNYDIVEPDPIIPAITFRKTFNVSEPIFPSKIIRGHDKRYVISGWEGNPIQGFVTMLDSTGNVVPNFPIIYPAPSTVIDITKTNSGYAFIGEVFFNNVLYSALAIFSKDFTMLKTVPFGNASQATFFFDFINENSGFAISGCVNINNTWNNYFIRTNLNGDILAGPKIYQSIGNQAFTGIAPLGNNYLAVGYDDSGTNNTKIFLTFLNPNGNLLKSPVNIENSQISFPYGIVRFTGGYAVLGKYDGEYGKTENFLVLCDNNGNELNSIKHLGIYSNETNFYSSGIINTAEGGFAIVGQSAADNIVLLIFDKTGNQISPSPIEYTHSGSQNAQDVIQTEDGGYAILGITDENAKQELLILKTDETGKINN